MIRSVWTTNFDQLTSRALGDQTVSPIEVGIDSAHRAVRATHSGELLIVSLHGDYRYDSLKNTTTELQEQEECLEQALVQEITNTPTIVCGYSGRDISVMNAFRQAYDQKGVGTLYWCIQDADNVTPQVRSLINSARSNGRSAYLVPIQGFDDLMIRLALHCLDHPGQERVTQLIAQNADTDGPRRTPFRIEIGHPTAVLKSNAFEIECPSEAIAFEPRSWPDSSVWRWVRDQTSEREVVAVPFKGQIFALGTVDDIRACFGDNIRHQPQRTPLFAEHLRHEDGAITSLLREALVCSMTHTTGVQSDGSRELWLTHSSRQEMLDGETYLVFHSVYLTLRQVDARTCLILKPSLKVRTPTDEAAPREVANTLKLRILGYQHNKAFNDAVNEWRQVLLTADAAQKSYEYPSSCASAFRFLIRKAPVFAEISGPSNMPRITVQPRFRVLLKQRGIEINEPALLFSNRSGSSTARDPHPVRGILNNRPFDYPLTRHQVTSEIRLGIVCPKAETKLLQAYLQKAASQIPPGNGESDYLPTFPGFQRAFGVDLLPAEPGTNGWAVCPEPSNTDDRANALEVARSIIRSIDMLQSSYSPHVVLIFFPERWSRFRGYVMETERFDVHDFVKANSVQRGIGTQFLDQSTLLDSMQCRVWWWLSLAFYVKGMRTPWVLDGLDRDRAPLWDWA